jgi:hypothetical protein
LPRARCLLVNVRDAGASVRMVEPQSTIVPAGPSGHALSVPIRKDPIVLPEDAIYLQVAQEVQYILLLGCTQHIERADHLAGFRAAARMRLDGC